MRNTLLPAILLASLALGPSAPAAESPAAPATFIVTDTSAEPVAPGKFEPTWKSLEQYEVPDWFRDAKFGIWAHWGPQCEPAAGDWYARGMYEEGSRAYRTQLAKYGHPSKVGFKDVIHAWKADKWDPEKLVALYKRAGAEYFFAMANHHDNLDLWDSQYQTWNSVAVGPKKNIVEGWANAAREQGLRFGLSIHASHAWYWYEPSQGADTKGDLAGVPYDGNITKDQGAGQWWEGLDPQDLYAQNHPRSLKTKDRELLHLQWQWEGGATPPSQAYVDKFYNRTIELINKYNPDLLYFDDTVLPFHPVSDAGLKIAAHFYNHNMATHGGQLEAVLLGKILNEAQRKCLVWDIERGASNRIEPFAWQTDTCIGGWHYSEDTYRRSRYKSSAQVIHMLADIVSKNGNLLLNVPVRGDGTIDDKELAIVEGIADWMEVNKESIIGTRPWKTFGEGPASGGAPLSAQGFNEGKGKPFSVADVRFTTKGGAIYAILLGVPDKDVAIKSLGTAAKLLDQPIRTVTLVGSDEEIDWTQTAAALDIKAPNKTPTGIAIVFKITS